MIPHQNQKVLERTMMTESMRQTHLKQIGVMQTEEMEPFAGHPHEALPCGVQYKYVSLSLSVFVHVCVCAQCIWMDHQRLEILGDLEIIALNFLFD